MEDAPCAPSSDARQHVPAGPAAAATASEGRSHAAFIEEGLSRDLGAHKLTAVKAGNELLLWDPVQIVSLRGIYRVSITPVGECSVKVATRGKAAAVPVVLSDEEVALCHSQGWLTAAEAATGAPVCLDTWLADHARCDPTGGVVLRRLVFADLWRQGYRCTSGIKFGVDYLSYTADPSVVHAAFMVVVLHEGTLTSPMELVGRARVATAALKICVFAYGDVGAGKVRYEAFRRVGQGGAVFMSASSTLVQLQRLQQEAPVAAEGEGEVVVPGDGAPL